MLWEVERAEVDLGAGAHALVEDFTVQTLLEEFFLDKFAEAPQKRFPQGILFSLNSQRRMSLLQLKNRRRSLVRVLPVSGHQRRAHVPLLGHSALPKHSAIVNKTMPMEIAL